MDINDDFKIKFKEPLITKATDDFPFYVKYEKNTLSLSLSPFEYNPPQISKDEETACKYVLQILLDNDIDVNKFSFEKTRDYIKLILAQPPYSCFCRLKFSGKKHYIALSLHTSDRKTLSSDPRFINFDFGNKRFSQIPIDTPEDILKYSDLIIPAYKWGTSYE